MVLLLGIEGQIWYKVPCCSFLVGSGWLVLLPSGLWMVIGISGAHILAHSNPSN